MDGYGLKMSWLLARDRARDGATVLCVLITGLGCQREEEGMAARAPSSLREADTK
jgi:hypothetical protein